MQALPSSLARPNLGTGSACAGLDSVQTPFSLCRSNSLLLGTPVTRVPITANLWGPPDPEARLSAAKGPAPALTPQHPRGRVWDRAKVTWLHQPPIKKHQCPRAHCFHGVCPPKAQTGPETDRPRPVPLTSSPQLGGAPPLPLGSALLAKLPPHPVRGPGPWFVASWRRTQIPFPAAQ